MDFIVNRGWMDKNENKLPTYDEITQEMHDDTDEENEETFEDFETKHNFRFEEGYFYYLKKVVQNMLLLMPVIFQV